MGTAQYSDTIAIFEQVLVAHEIQYTHPDSAYRISQEVEFHSKKLNYPSGIAYAHMRMAAINQRKGRLKKAKSYFLSAKRIRKSKGDFKGAIHACIDLSFVYENLGQIDSAFALMYEALDLQKNTKNLALLAEIYLNLGHLASTNNQSESEVLNFYSQVEEIGTTLNDQELLVQVHNELGSYYFNTQQLGKSLSHHLEVSDLLRITPDSISEVSNFNNLANCYVEMEAYEVAENYYLKQIKWSKELSLLEEEALAHYNLGVLFFKQNQYNTSLSYFSESLSQYQILMDLPGQAKNYQSMSAVKAARKDYKSAFNLHVLYADLSKKILNNERQQTIAELQVKYDTQQKELALQLSQEEEKTQKAQKNVFITGSIVLALLLLLAILIYAQKQRVNEKNRILQEQKMKGVLDDQELKTYQAMMKGQEEERLRISADLHDRLGSMLSTVKLLFSGLEDKIDQQQESNNQQYNKAKYIIDDACTEIRRISHNLGAGMVANFGLTKAVHELCDSINQSDKIACYFSHHHIPDDVPLKVETELYRIVQEAFNNIIKHAQASEIQVQLNGHPNEINLIIEDNGVGFDAKDKKSTTGLGLKSIQNRVSLLGGSYHLDTVKGRGTTFIIDIPINWTNDEDLHS
ncbi:MAG: tetratricopeptide repeat-containing sensor histidine kinase [Salibacteraceae bacterium]